MTGLLLQNLRKDRRMTMDELAAIAQVSRHYLWQVENGLRTTPPLAVLERLAKALGATVGELIG